MQQNSISKIGACAQAGRLAPCLSPAGGARAWLEGAALQGQVNEAREISPSLSPGHRPWLVARDDLEGRPAGAQSSAWPLWLCESGRDRAPLVYWLQARSLPALCAAQAETGARGIFLNTAESSVPTRWPKGVDPFVPQWLNGNAAGLPYDPSSWAEAQALISAALQRHEGYSYLALHDDPIPAEPLDVDDAKAADRGMYRFRFASGPGERSRVRLCGAGRALQRVLTAAQRLQIDWDIDCEVWSCPSYTRLAREAGQVGAERWSHLQRCLGTKRWPVIAVTDYARHVAEQIGAYVQAPFVAIGADSMDPERLQRPSVEFIVVATLKALADDGRVTAAVVAEALQRYALLPSDALDRRSDY